MERHLKFSKEQKGRLMRVEKNTGKETLKKLKPWERKSPWEDPTDEQELWKREDILSLNEADHPQFILAKNKARFYRMVNWYKGKQEWLEVAPLSGLQSLLKQQKKELEDIRLDKSNYEWELEIGTLTSSQQSYRRDELKMCEVHEKMAVSLIAKIQSKKKISRR